MEAKKYYYLFEGDSVIARNREAGSEFMGRISEVRAIDEEVTVIDQEDNAFDLNYADILEVECATCRGKRYIITPLESFGVGSERFGVVRCVDCGMEHFTPQEAAELARHDGVRCFIESPYIVVDEQYHAPRTWPLTDAVMEDKWRELEDVPMDEYDGPGEFILAADWWVFCKDTNRNIIWGFFNVNHSKGVRYLMHSLESKGTLLSVFCGESLEKLKGIVSGEWYPECEKHPTEQAEWAKALIMDIKGGDAPPVNVLSHGMVLVNALEVYAERYKIPDRCRFYNVDESGVHDVTTDRENLWKPFAAVLQHLENEKYSDCDED
jgi:hypothetical protein